MSTVEAPRHLNNHHRDTVTRIYAHPMSHNIEWPAVQSLLGAVGEIEERHDGKFTVTVAGRTVVLERPRHKDIDVEMVTDLRGLLSAAGYGPDGSQED